MAKKDKDNGVNSLIEGLKKTADEQKVEKNVVAKEEKLVKNNEANEQKEDEVKPKSTRGRKKKSNVKRVVKGNKITYIKEDDAPVKANKTFYLSTLLIEEIEKMAEEVGLSSSDLIEDAIQLLLNNSTLKGFKEDK
ncbi:ribbon-helix-helix protein, CopG family [Clostridium perfringens]|uniref:ribbon-helix-helix protein, CopG family n=3 Tax=Clostridium perfringens TaxID=1502 RepID=UPI0013E2872C|nr:ribbon-helix-helix protein, CopG family [Clostridium perfringens]MBI6025083.1 ribbon-helix-helix protein, CopG family [Clostridium perfringens]MDJ8927803.1 ribbon-helix-helix protein, CopG family [Clostridium perfringens]MDJ8930700.1 ribbon-helix-helix protein, CopG family [Clostridium perfringens]MDJ8936473.1 ribbon-helix-helix protein, CopG family [Clostridium perfringens]MDJ8954046.1 ribbon-helix-helix protein, CopG family [Clostridium perfringens]